MKQSQDPNNDHLITRGVLLVGSGVLFAHVLFPFIWWNVMGGSAYFSNPQMIYGIPTNYRVVTYTPVIRATATVTATVTAAPKQAGSGWGIVNHKTIADAPVPSIRDHQPAYEEKPCLSPYSVTSVPASFAASCT